MPKIRRRQRCPKCGSLSIIRWGLREGRQRYKCQDCGASFVKHKEGVSRSNRLVWYRKWVLGKQTIEDIACDSGYSARQLHRWFDGYGSPLRGAPGNGPPRGGRHQPLLSRLPTVFVNYTFFTGTGPGGRRIWRNGSDGPCSFSGK